MTESPREQPTLSGLLNQFEAIGGPEEFGPEGLAIMVALWRKSSKLGWRNFFQMTNTDLTCQTGIRSRETINTHRKKLVNAGLIEYTAPPRGQARGDYKIRFNLLDEDEVVGEPVQKLDKVDGEVVQNMDHFSQVDGEPVRKLDHLADTVLKDFTTTPTTTADVELDSGESESGIMEIVDAYCRLNNKLDIHVTANERDAMGKMVAGGMPNPFTIRTMESLLEAKRQREGSRFSFPNSFLYYVPGIKEAWVNQQVDSKRSADPNSVSNQPVMVESPKRLSKQQRELDDLRRRAKEERQRGQSRSV
ncbi:hypothetical protein Q5741_18830 [Paenibacillus sp. JX-17]|uniref:Helix-turn-helix domain-containing protein n=1 Tax=Paenibacillus lacisoli TaxID=3064525 RepID=A0ABT9CGR1_9BACL|nr:hypothetical protein [Paenibacillus sp. JX-17]MDO7908459.1 hypothetical protein [Paenibacillus sp. JX-17]